MKEVNPEHVCVATALTFPKYHDELFEVINSPIYFEDEDCREIIKACIAIRELGRTPDLVSVAEKSKVNPKIIFSYTSLDYFYEWQNAALTVRERWMFRKFKEACARGIEADYEDIFDLLTGHSEEVNAIVSSVDTLKTEKIQDIAIQAINDIAKLKNNEITGAPSGIYKLDTHTRGFQPSDLVIVAARPGMGKTAFALNAGRASAQKGTVLFFSLEMSAIQLVKRMHAQDGRVTMDEIFKDSPSESKWPILMEIADNIGQRDIEIYDRISYIEDIAAKVSTVSKRKKVSLVVIDYLGLCSTRERVQSEEVRVSRISWKCKQMAKRSNVPVMLLSQLSREVEKRANKRPQLSDLRYSGAIEQDADMVLFPWWSQKYEMLDEKGEYYGLIDIAKYRNGEPLEVGGLVFEGRHVRWVEDGGMVTVPAVAQNVTRKQDDLPF